MTRTVVRGDSLDFEVANVIGGQTRPVLGYIPVLEVRRRPWMNALTVLTGGDGISGQPADTSWSVSMPPSLTMTFAEQGRQARVYYQLRVADGTRVHTIEDGELFVDRDCAAISPQGWQPSTVNEDAEAGGGTDYGGFE